MNTDLPPAGLRPKAAAAYVGVSPAFLRGLPITPIRVPGSGPKRKPILIYLRSELDAWLAQEASRRDPELRSSSQRAS